MSTGMVGFMVYVYTMVLLFVAVVVDWRTIYEYGEPVYSWKECFIAATARCAAATAVIVVLCGYVFLFSLLAK